MNKYKPYFLSIIAAFLFCASGPQFITADGIPFLALVGSIIFWSQWNNQRNGNQSSVKSKWLITLVYNIALALFSFYWIPETLKSFGPMPLYMGWILFILFSPFIYFQNLLIAFFLYQIQKKPRLAKLNHPLIIAIVATVFEWIEIRQFPVNLSSTWIQWGHSMPLSTIFGEGIYSFLLYALVFYFTSQANSLSHQRVRWSIVMILILDFLFSFSFPANEYLISNPKAEQYEKVLNIRIVQANIGNFLKVAAESGEENSVESIHRDYRDLSFRPHHSKHGPLDLIIWPETAIPDDFNTEMLKNFPSFLPTRMLDLFQSNLHKNADYMIGGYDRGYLSKSMNGIETEYNSVIHFDASGKLKDVYHKKVLIPFGEGLPLPQWMGREVAKIIPGLSFFSQGHRYTVFQIKSGWNIISPICYEILFSSFIRQYLNSATKDDVNLILNLTNDSWYGKTAEPFQHLMLAKWRAVEFRTPIIRSTNTGITSVIDANGKESKRLFIGEKNILDLSLGLPKSKTNTPYQDYGRIPLVLLMIAMLVFLKMSDKRKKYSQ